MLLLSLTMHDIKFNSSILSTGNQLNPVNDCRGMSILYHNVLIDLLNMSGLSSARSSSAVLTCSDCSNLSI